MFRKRKYENFITPYEAAYELEVSLTTIYNLLRAGKIPAVKIGRQWRIPADAFDYL